MNRPNTRISVTPVNLNDVNRVFPTSVSSKIAFNVKLNVLSTHTMMIVCMGHVEATGDQMECLRYTLAQGIHI